MKKILTLCMIGSLSACATSDVEVCEKAAEAPQPVYAQRQYVPIQNQAPRGYAYTVSEPVEVIYKNTTYRTVYEPKTTATTAFVKKPYTCGQGELCKNASGAQPTYNVVPQE